MCYGYLSNAGNIHLLEGCRELFFSNCGVGPGRVGGWVAQVGRYTQVWDRGPGWRHLGACVEEGIRWELRRDDGQGLTVLLVL